MKKKISLILATMIVAGTFNSILYAEENISQTESNVSEVVTETTPTPTVMPQPTQTTEPTQEPTEQPTQEPLKETATKAESLEEIDFLALAEEICEKSYVYLYSSGRKVNRNSHIKGKINYTDAGDDNKFVIDIKENKDNMADFLEGLVQLLIPDEDMTKNDVDNNVNYYSATIEIYQGTPEQSEKDLFRLNIIDEDFILESAYLEKPVMGKITGKTELEDYIIKNKKLLAGNMGSASASTKGTLNTTKKIYNNSGYKLVETLSFDVVPNESYYDTAFTEAGDIGTTVNCTIEQCFISSQKSIYLLTLSGNKGTKRFWKLSEGSDEITEETLEDSLTFDYQYYMSGDYMVWAAHMIAPSVVIEGTATNETVTGIKVHCINADENLDKIENVTATNVKYERYSEVTEEMNSRNLCFIFGSEEKQEYVKEKEEEENRDPNISINNMRLYDEDGDVQKDVYIVSVAEAGLNLTEKPEWYEALGDNVKLYVVIQMHTYYGNDKGAVPLLRFAGDKGEQWFWVSSWTPEGWGDVEKNKVTYVDVMFNSVISYDGFTCIKNTKEYDDVAIRMHIDDNDNIVSMELKTDTEAVVINKEDMNIKGGDFSYEDWGKAQN